MKEKRVRAIYDDGGKYMPGKRTPKAVRDRFWDALVWCEENPGIVQKTFRCLPEIPFFDRDFVIQSHCIHAAWVSANKWSKKKGMTFMNWFRLKLAWEVRDAVKYARQDQRKGFVYGYEALHSNDEDSGFELSFLADRKSRNEFKQLDQRIDLDQVFNDCLGQRSRKIVRMYRDGWTMKEIGKELNFCESRISQLFDQCRNAVLSWCALHGVEL